MHGRSRVRPSPVLFRALARAAQLDWQQFDRQNRGWQLEEAPGGGQVQEGGAEAHRHAKDGGSSGKDESGGKLKGREYEPRSSRAYFVSAYPRSHATAEDAPCRSLARCRGEIEKPLVCDCMTMSRGRESRKGVLPLCSLGGFLHGVPRGNADRGDAWFHSIEVDTTFTASSHDHVSDSVTVVSPVYGD